MVKEQRDFETLDCGVWKCGRWSMRSFNMSDVRSRGIGYSPELESHQVAVALQEFFRKLKLVRSQVDVDLSPLDSVLTKCLGSPIAEQFLDFLSYRLQPFGGYRGELHFKVLSMRETVLQR